MIKTRSELIEKCEHLRGKLIEMQKKHEVDGKRLVDSEALLEKMEAVAYGKSPIESLHK